MCWLKKKKTGVYFVSFAQNDPVQLQLLWEVGVASAGVSGCSITSSVTSFKKKYTQQINSKQKKKKMPHSFAGDKMWDFTFITLSLLSLLWLQSSYLWSLPELSAAVYSRLLITPLFAVLVTSGEISCL